jgi:phage-related protein
MFDLGSIVAHIKADVSDFKKGVEEAHTSAGNLASKFESAAGSSKILLGGVAAAGAGIAAFGALAVKNYMEEQNASAQMDAVLQSTHHSAGLYKEDLMDQANALQNVTKYSNETVMAAQNMLLTFTEIKGPVMQEATSVTLDMAQALGMDATQAAMQLGKALNDPATGMTKLQRIGVTFTQQQMDTAKHLTETGQTAKAQEIILGELRKEFGGSAEAAGKTFGGQLTILQNALGDLTKGFGKAIVDGVTPFLTGLNGFVASLGTGEDMLNRFKAGINAIQPYILPVALAIGAALVPALWAMASAAIAATAAFIAPLLPFLAIGAAVGYLINQFGGLHVIVGIFQQVWNFLKPSFDALWATIQNELLPTLMGVYNMIAPWLIPTLKFLAQVLGAELVIAIYVAINVLRIVISVISSVIGIVAGLIGWFWNASAGIRSAMAPVVGWIAGALGGVWDAITGPFRAAFDWVKGAVKDVVNKLKDLNPFQRHSPSLFDLVDAGTKAITGSYQAMFGAISDVPSAASLAPQLGVSASNPSALGTVASASPGTQVTINMDGVMTSSQADMRTVANQLVGAIDEELTAKGKQTILPAGVTA